MNKKKFKLIIIILFVALLAPGGLFFYYNSSPVSMETSIFTVPYGASISTIAQKLERSHAIKNALFYKIIATVRGRRSLKAGNYKIYRGMSSLDILNRMTRGKILTAKVTIPEGYNIFSIAEKLDRNEICDKADFLYYAKNQNYLRSRDIDYISCEGYLFPDTYIFARGADPRDVIASMHKKMKTVLSDVKDNYKTTMDTHTILILASLIEKEAVVKKEQRYISSVFHNRISLGMRLDCDPTVRYAVKRFKGPIYYKDLKSTSPYNTYKHTGLPPTPIASPGKKAIIAAVNPETSPYLYFVSRNDGSHYFSKNLKEHNRAVQFYQRGKNNGFVDTQKLTK